MEQLEGFEVLSICYLRVCELLECGTSFHLAKAVLIATQYVVLIRRPPPLLMHVCAHVFQQ